MLVCRTIPVVLIVGILVISFTVAPSFADTEHRSGTWHKDNSGHKSDRGHNDNKQLISKQCDTGHAKKIIEVKQKILNSVDSGVAGNNWAQDDYSRHIDVWQLDDGSFCAILKYEGRFVTFAGPSPGGTSTVDDGIKGSFEGGYRTTIFTGTFDPSVSTHGNIGIFDYQCDVSGNCPGFVDWTGLYFTNVSGFDLAWWGWGYHAGKHGYWVNSIDGNFGDIT